MIRFISASLPSVVTKKHPIGITEGCFNQTHDKPVLLNLFGSPAILLSARIRGFASPDFSGYALVGSVPVVMDQINNDKLL